MKKLFLILLLLWGATTKAQSSVSANLGPTYANGSLIAELLPAAGGNVATTHIFLDANGSTTIQTLVPGKTYGFWASAVDGTALLYGRVTVTGAPQDITSSLFAVGGSNGTCNVGLAGPGGIFTVSGTPAACNAVLTLMTTGNSGGVPCFVNTNTLNSSATLSANTLTSGGGTGACPGNSSVTDDKVNPTRMPNGVNMGSSYLVIESQNTSPGTQLNALACNAGANVSICPVNPGPGTVVGISEQGSGGSSGIVALCILGPCPVVFDNQSTIGDVAVPSLTVAGSLHDTGGATSVNGYNFRVTGANAGAGTVGAARPPGDIAGGNSLTSCLTTAGDLWSATTGGTCQRLAVPVSPAGVFQFVGTLPSGVPSYYLPGIVPRFVTTLTDTILATDRAQFVQYTNATPQSVTLPQPGSAGFANNFMTCVQNRTTTGVPSTGVVTFTPTSSTINGQSTYQLTQNNNSCFISDNTNWFTKDGGGGGGGSSILSTNNQFTGTNNFGANVAFAGPNPWYDLTQYGLYQGSGAPITCSITIGTNTASCGGGIGDFAVGQGIEIPLAGAAPTFDAWGTTVIDNYSRNANVATYHVVSTFVGPPQTITISGLSDSSFNGTFTITGSDQGNHFTVANTGANVASTAGSGLGTLTSPAVVVTSNGILNGTTRYDYKVVMRDYNGALSAASPAGTLTTGAATLGNNVIAVTGCARASGIVTCTTSSPHNLQTNVPISLVGTSTGLYDGQHQVASTPTSTTFTYTVYGATDDSNPPTGGNINVTAKNTVRWNMHPNQQLQAFIYRSINSGAYALVGITEGMDGSFVDWGISTLPGGQYLAPQAPYISTGVPTASTVNGILAARITGISVTTLTLDTNATATATSQPAAHDNAPIIIAGCAAINAGPGNGNLYIPNGGAVVFNSILNLRDKCTWPNPNKLKILVNSSLLVVNEPIVLRLVHNDWESIGGGGAAASFATGQPSSGVQGNAYPFFYNPAGNGPTYFKNFLMSSYRGYQSGIVEDQGVSTGTANTEYDNIDIGGYSGSMPVILRGGAFQHRFERGVISTGNDYAAPEPLLITTPNALGSSWGSLGGDVVFDQTVFIGKGVLYETWGIGAQQVGYTTFTDNLMESGVAPMIRFNLAGTNSAVQGITMRNPSYSDTIFNATPMIELGSNGTAFTSFLVLNPQCGGPLFAGGGGDISILGVCDPIGASQYKLDGYGGTSSSLYSNANVGTNGGYFYTQMARPAAPTLGTSTTGGFVTNGPHQYAIIAVDALNNPTLFGPQVLITTGGSNTSTVTVTPPTLPTGAVGYRVLRYDSADPSHFFGTTVLCSQLTTPINGPFVDTIANGTECGDTETSVSLAGTSILSSGGLYSPSVTMFPTLFANLGAPANGKFVFCPDCVVANPCVGGGSGALAQRLNGVWACTGGGGGGGSTWNTIPNPIGNLTLAMGTNTSLFNTTSAGSTFWSWKNTTPAIVGTSQGSPFLNLCGRAWHGSADVEDCLTLNTLPGNGNDAAITFTIGHTGTSTGPVTTVFPGGVQAGPVGGIGGIVAGPEGTVCTGLLIAWDYFCANSTLHRWTMFNNGGTLDWVMGAVDVQNQAEVYAADSGAADAYVVTLTPAITAYVAGQRFSFKAVNANLTTTPTVAISGLAAKTITKNGGAALAASDIKAGQIIDVEYDGTNMQMQSTLGNAAAGGGGTAFGVNAQTANYTAVSGDNGKLISMNGTGLTLTLPASPPSATWGIHVENQNATSLTINPNAVNLDGVVANIVVGAKQGLFITTDGTNYLTMSPAGRITATPGFLLGCVGPNLAAAASSIIAPQVSALTNRVYVCEFYVPYSIKIGHISATVTTVQAATNFSVGLYDSTGTLVIDSGVMSCASSGNVTATPTAVAIPPGIYYQAVSMAGTTCGLSGINGAASVLSATGVYNAQTVKFGHATNLNSGTALPSTLGVLTGDAAVGQVFAVFEP